jgi:hypothetical protein
VKQPSKKSFGRPTTVGAQVVIDWRTQSDLVGLFIAAACSHTLPFVSAQQELFFIGEWPHPENPN